MKMIFDETKATQTAAMFLKLSGGRLQFLALIKLLYMLDREAIDRWGLPVTTDRYVSMKLGPVTSHIYNLIKQSSDSSAPSFWSTHIGRDQFAVTLFADPGETELSAAEENLAAEIYARNQGKDGFQLADDCHNQFGEWEDPGASSRPIPIESILEALGKSEEDWTHTERSMAIQNTLSNLMAK